jgi:tetratricopeptide (TPR) repeat protein
MAPENNSATTPRITGGQAGIRGYLVQTLIALLDGVLSDPPFDRVIIEPDHVSEKIDMLWEAPNGRRAVQVKSSANQFTESDVRRWAQELEAAHSASEYRLCLVGLHGSGVAAMDREGKVAIDKKNLDLSGFREQAAHRLDRFLRDEGLDAGTPDDREMLADALTARLATYSTTGQPMMRADLIRLLRSWVAEAPKAGLQIAPSRLRHGADQLFGRDKELAQLGAALDNPAIHVLSIVAWGGVGKTSLVVEWMNRLSAKGWPGIARIFDWSFYSQGTRDQSIVSSDTFIASALRFFGDEEISESGASPWDKGARLAELVAQRPAILVLDGIESMQYPPGPLGGKLKDPAIEVLLKGLSRQNCGLCIVTTRETLSDLTSYADTVAPELKLDHLGEEAGAALLGSTGVVGPDGELRAASREVRGHALTLRLLGTFLAQAHQGDIRKRDLVKFQEADAEVQGGHAFRVIAAYEKWLGTGGEKGKQHLAILRLMALFDRPASAHCLAVLRKRPPIADLTEPLLNLSDAQWNLCLSRLTECGLLHVQEDQSVDSHPLIREYFGKQLRDMLPNAWRKAHARLYRHLKDTTKDKKEPTIEDLQPLYQAVSHGCRAGLHQQACGEVLYNRIRRGEERYSISKLGAAGTDLCVIVCFFEHPWGRLVPNLSEEARGWLLTAAAFCLRALGRLTEALDPARAAVQTVAGTRDWPNASISACNLSELELALGNMPNAMRDAEEAVGFADRSGEEFMTVSSRPRVANVLHQCGQHEEALARFRDAEAMQAERQPGYPLLYSDIGFQYCEVLLVEAEQAAWRVTCTGDPFATENAAGHRAALTDVERRAAQILRWQEDNPAAPILDFALGHLTLGHAALYRAILEKSRVDNAESEIERAAEEYHRAGTTHHIPHALLTRAWLRFLEGDADASRADLEEAWEIAERGPMRLHMADIHLHRARLFKDKEELKKARAMIQECGYWRRKEELEDAEEAAKNW